MRVTSHTTLVVGKAGKSEHVLPGTPVEIEDEEARDLIARGIAIKVGKAEAKPTEKETKEPQAGKTPADQQADKSPVDGGGKQP